MSNHFYESGAENAPECECLHKEFYPTVGAERIRSKWRRVNKTPIQHERESDT